MGKNQNNEEDILILGEKQEEIQAEQERDKRMILPIVLMIIGVILMLCGYFFKDITNFLGIDLNKEQKKISQEENEVSNKKILKCVKNSEDKTLGIKTKITYIYTFQNKQLQNLNEKRVIEPLENSDIGPDNIKVIYGKYTDVITKTEGINGISTSSNYNNNQLKINIEINYKQLGNTKIPDNDKIKVVNSFNETYGSVKQKITSDKDVLCE